MDTVYDFSRTEQRMRDIARILENLEADTDAISIDEGSIAYHLSCLDDEGVVTLDANKRRALAEDMAHAARNAARKAMMDRLKPRLNTAIDGFYRWPE